MPEDMQEFVEEIQASQTPNGLPEPEECRRRIISNDYADFIFNTDVVYQDIQELYGRYCVQIVNRQFVTMYADRSRMLPLSVGNYTYTAIPNCYTLLDTAALDASGITQIQNQPTLNLTGKGVIIGFIDTGIDYQNEIFRNPDGSSRILAIWDQTDQTGQMPENINYGSVYRKERIDEALRLPDPYELVPSRDEDGHGTMMASVAAGGRNPEQDFTGAAPEADLVVVKLKEAKEYLRQFYFINPDAKVYQENDIMFGIRFIGEIAAQYNRPVVFCIGLGTNQGDHGGSSPLGLYITDTIGGRGRAMVIGTGNEGNQGHHFAGKLEQSLEYQDAEVRVGAGELGFTLELWGQIPDIFSVSIISPTGESVPRTMNRIGFSEVYNMVFSGTTVYIDYRAASEISGSQIIFMRFETPIQGIWTIRVFGNNVSRGIYNMWLPVRGFTVTDVVFLRPEPDMTLTEPSAVTSAISVGTYNDSNGSIYLDSGRGFARDNIVKPEFAAPGVNVYSGLPANQFGNRTGSSVSAALTAGAVALLLQWTAVEGNDVAITPVQLKNYLIRGTSRKPNLTYPNQSWGYGALDLYGTFQNL